MSSCSSATEHVTCHPSSTCIFRVREFAGLLEQRLSKECGSEAVGRKPALVRRLMIFIILMICLLDTVAAPVDFRELPN